MNFILGETVKNSSKYFIKSPYLLKRLHECVSKISATERFAGPHCPLIFDSWSCFDPTLPGDTANANCPDIEVLGFQTNNLAEELRK